MRLLILCTLCLAVAGLSGCSEDFTVAAPYKQITVVSGILNQKDTAHYIRIQKAFMDENKSAVEMSKEPDSSFYNNLTVTLLEYNTQRTSVLSTIPLYRVDLNNEGYKKDDPLNDQQFFTSPNYAYKFIKYDLDPALWYKLLIHNNSTGRTDSSQFVGVVNADSNRVNDGFYVVEFARANYELSFPRTTPLAALKMNLSMPRNARMTEGHIRFHYVEKNVATMTETRDSVDFLFDTETADLKNGASFDLNVLNSNIYSFLLSEIGAAPDNVERYLDSCDIFLYAGGPELYYNSTINQGQSSGLTADNIQPNFSNFTSGDVIGVFSSRAMRVYRNAAIDKVTIDSLKINPLTQPLRIKGVSDN